MPGRQSVPPFSSFWMGGFEGADHVNGRGEHLDMVRATGHADRLDQDYRRARLLGIRTVRESIGWRLTEVADGQFDFSRAIAMAKAAQRQGVQILWTLMHYGVPPGLTLLDDALVPRFARFAAEAARVLAPLCPGPRFYTPINEISFLSWAASASDAMGPAGSPPEARQPDLEEDSRVSGFQIKRRLVRAALAGIRAIREVDPQARFLHVEPVVHVVPPPDQPEFRTQADRISAFQWQAFDMLAGRMEPELGGHPEALDWLGLNHYHSSQWETPSEKRLAWHLRDPRRQPLADLLEAVWRRYHRPLIVAETGHIGVGRAAWLQEIAGEAQRARARGVPLGGVCLYPMLDRPDWHDSRVWHRSGMWHVPPSGQLRLNKPFARALLNWRHLNDPARLVTSTPDGSDTDKSGLMVMLPQPWETWSARHQAAVLALAEDFVLRLVEPPRDSAVPAVLRRHTLAPHAELLVLHRPRPRPVEAVSVAGAGDSRPTLEATSPAGIPAPVGESPASGWAAVPDEEALALLRKDREQMRPRRWWCWPWRSPGGAVDAAWITALAGDGLIHHPCQAGDRPPVTLESLVRLELPADWPPPPVALRRLVPDSYEDEETRRWIEGPVPSSLGSSAVVPPILWLQMGAPGGATPPPSWWKGSLDTEAVHAIRAVARQHPAWRLLVDANAPPVNGEADPANLRWAGRLPPPLETPMAAAVQAALPFEVWAPAAMDPRTLSALCGEAMAPVDPCRLRQDAGRVQAAHRALAASTRQQLHGLIAGPAVTAPVR
ncbi:hypothetical protein [Roseateles terrae]|uniref:Beta-glucosidase/6-phospho-beta-glucosidase/beta-galactosidase n=1 Tax=Roseateles terrae TaxID=431060 RepID=A0ABR6GLW7_9BURK|nr:hypothetical protein [Roseateles terrae]MBB3192706.1 beta-glucosidase/6-phospho-beta-glucosidase/beta-galactosidase [Roseateles terrae]OWQ90011.1 hypothetical protein CDN98_05885 [Roseateles terrae]